MFFLGIRDTVFINPSLIPCRLFFVTIILVNDTRGSPGAGEPGYSLFVIGLGPFILEVQGKDPGEAVVTLAAREQTCERPW